MARCGCACPRAGDTITLLDSGFRSKGMTAASTLSAHSGGICDMDISEDLLVTCGFVARADGQVFNDIMVKVCLALCVLVCMCEST
jgi:hypothetical protein